MNSDLAGRVSETLGRDVVASSRVTGGDVAEAYRVVLVDGTRVFVKTHASPPPHFFDTEATGLRWLREAAPTGGQFSIPDVLAVDEHMLALEWIDEGSAAGTGSIETSLGRGLALLHRLSAVGYGRSDRRTTGSRALPNEPCADWPSFYATQRLQPLARLAADSEALDASTIHRIEALAAVIDRLDGADEPAALLHGDLWAGNRLVDEAGRNWLVDPACHGGHRESDLAMMRLFGGFGDACFAAYDDEYPLAEGWLDRVALHQLAPLVVHAIKFGGGYAAAVERAVAVSERLL